MYIIGYFYDQGLGFIEIHHQSVKHHVSKPVSLSKTFFAYNNLSLTKTAINQGTTVYIFFLLSHFNYSKFAEIIKIYYSIINVIEYSFISC